MFDEVMLVSLLLGAIFATKYVMVMLHMLKINYLIYKYFAFYFYT